MNERTDVLRETQRELSLRVVAEDVFRKPIAKISGVDLAFAKEEAVIACVTARFPSLEPVEERTLVVELEFPYVPTLLCFREGPAIVKMICARRIEADVFLINSHGIAHPLFCGCASYVGVMTGKPTVGVASSNLCGEYDREPEEVGEAVAVCYEGRAVGWILKSKAETKPIFISPGHMVGVDSSLKIVRECLRDHRLPEPLQLAHNLANREKRALFG